METLRLKHQQELDSISDQAKKIRELDDINARQREEYLEALAAKRRGKAARNRGPPGSRDSRAGNSRSY